MCLVDGTVREFLTENITIATPFYRGQMKAVCMERPIYHLIIGNIEGMETQDEDQRKLRSNAVEDQINAVQTRLQAKISKEVKPLNVPGATNIDNVGLE